VKGIRGDQVEGRRAVRELLTAGRRRVRDVWLAEPPGTGSIDELADLAAATGAAVHRVSADELDARARTETPQGVMASADPIDVDDLDTLLDGSDVFLVALEGVTDPRNLGAVLRSAEGAGATGVVLPRHRGVQITAAATKAAAGAIEHLRFATVGGIPAALDRARRASVWTIGLDGSGETLLFDLALADQPLMLVLGAEGDGLGRLARERCDALVRIPMVGQIESLNVASAATLACYEVARRRSG